MSKFDSLHEVELSKFMQSAITIPFQESHTSSFDRAFVRWFFEHMDRTILFVVVQVDKVRMKCCDLLRMKLRENKAIVL